MAHLAYARCSMPFGLLKYGFSRRYPADLLYKKPDSLKSSYDVIIIGSGPGGLGAALALASQNNNNCHGSVAVFERASAFRPIAVPLVPPSVSVCWATKLWKSWAWRYVLFRAISAPNPTPNPNSNPLNRISHFLTLVN